MTKCSFCGITKKCVVKDDVAICTLCIAKCKNILTPNSFDVKTVKEFKSDIKITEIKKQ